VARFGSGGGRGLNRGSCARLPAARGRCGGALAARRSLRSLRAAHVTPRAQRRLAGGSASGARPIGQRSASRALPRPGPAPAPRGSEQPTRPAPASSWICAQRDRRPGSPPSASSLLPAPRDGHAASTRVHFQRSVPGERYRPQDLRKAQRWSGRAVHVGRLLWGLASSIFPTTRSPALERHRPPCSVNCQMEEGTCGAGVRIVGEIRYLVFPLGNHGYLPESARAPHCLRASGMVGGGLLDPDPKMIVSVCLQHLPKDCTVLSSLQERFSLKQSRDAFAPSLDGRKSETLGVCPRGTRERRVLCTLLRPLTHSLVGSPAEHFTDEETHSVGAWVFPSHTGARREKRDRQCQVCLPTRHPADIPRNTGLRSLSWAWFFSPWPGERGSTFT
jgi:hypothetical protein